MATTARELFVHELRDSYDAEHRLVDSLKEMSSKVSDPELTKAFDLHRQQTERQIKRLETVFSSVDERPERESCEGIQGLIEEFKSFNKEEDPSTEVLNLFAAVSAKKVEHYEIVAYESLMQLARQLGLRDAQAALRENLAEELATADQLQGMSEKLLTELV